MSNVQRQREIFEAALAALPAEREAIVHQLAQQDFALAEAVLALLATDADAAINPGAGAAMAPVQKMLQSLTLQTPAHLGERDWIGQQIGPYQVQAELGRGGMGVVLLAQRTQGDFAQAVAIKVVHGIVDQQAKARFSRERELLARLNHPNIAKLIDGGELTCGQPYLVMEFVPGLPLCTWMQTQRPSLVLRLEVFRELCSAMQHAHQHLIVHRDLKPANVLIDEHNRPKLLDFGIARLVDQSIGEHATTERMMTLAYASPEQLRGGMATTASDIYTLGLLLYEILVGESMRSEQESHANRSFISKKPSDRARLVADASIRDQAGRLRGDLDHIVLKCTRTEAAERYVSAAAVAQDVTRYLQHRPLESRRGELRYAVWKFIRRNPLSVASFGVLMLALSWFSVQLKLERDRAQTAAVIATEQAELAKQTTQYLVTLFKSADPANARGKELSAREVVDRGFASLKASPLDSPTVRAKLLATFGEIYLEIGMPEPALAGLEQALQLLPVGEAYDLERALIFEHLSNAQQGANQIPAATQSAQQAQTIYETKRGKQSIEVARVLIRLGIYEQSNDQFSQARLLFERALEIAQAQPGQRDMVAEALQFLGVGAARTHQLELAERYLREALTIKRAALGSDHPRTLDTLQALTVVLGRKGDIPAWDAVAKELTEGRKRVHGPDSSPYFQSLFARVSLLSYQLELRAAESLAREMIAGFDKLSAEPLMEDTLAYDSLANVLEERGEVAEALVWQQRAVDVLSNNQALQSKTAFALRLRLAQLQLHGKQAIARQQAEQLLADVLRADQAQPARTTNLDRPQASLDALEARLLIRRIDDSAASPHDNEQAQLWLDQLQRLRGRTSPLWLLRALEFAEHDSNPQRALTNLQRWRAYAKNLPLLDAKYAIAIAERRIALQPNDTNVRRQAGALVAPFAPALRGELAPGSALLLRLEALLKR